MSDTFASDSALRRLAATELKLFLRERSGPLFGVGFPLVLLVIFGNIPYYRRPLPVLGGLTLLDTYVPILITFVVAMLSLNVLPPVLAGYREKGVLRRLQTTPVGPARVLTVQLVISLAVEAVSVSLLLTVARLAFGVVLPRRFTGFIVVVAFAAVALIAIGLFVAAAAPSGRAANAIGSILFYPMVFFAGLFLPVATMPPILQRISHVTPLGAAVQALQQTAAGDWPHLQPLLTMTAYAIVFWLGATRLFRWE